MEKMKLAKHVKIREEKFGVVIFDTLREKVFVANKQGKDILHHLLDGKSQEETVEALMLTYNESREKIGKDVENFIGQLVERNLLVEVG
jgi:hypothetical protein